MAHVRKDQPGSAPGHEWSTPGEVVEVHDPVLAHQLLRLPGFSEAQAPEPTPEVELDKVESHGGPFRGLAQAPEHPPLAVVQVDDEPEDEPVVKRPTPGNKRRAR
jgi:hypothetical protein